MTVAGSLPSCARCGVMVRRDHVCCPSATAYRQGCRCPGCRDANAVRARQAPSYERRQMRRRLTSALALNGSEASQSTARSGAAGPFSGTAGPVGPVSAAGAAGDPHPSSGPRSVAASGRPHH